MTFVKGDSGERRCLNCNRKLSPLQEKYCKLKCQYKYRAKFRSLSIPQRNIITALTDAGGIRWLPDSESLQSLLTNHLVPLVEIINRHPVGIGRLIDYQVRLTREGVQWAVYNEKEISP